MTVHSLTNTKGSNKGGRDKIWNYMYSKMKFGHILEKIIIAFSGI